MRIQTNVAALNSYRNYTGNTSALAKSVEKLSSGYRINRAGDDAAGLAISEKMRAQVTGLKAAQRNSKNGISLVQTAEGALTEVHSMLNRMVDLAEQASNGTIDDETDRANLHKETEALKVEINRIADASNFNGIKMLDGSLSGGSTTATGDRVPFKLSDAQFDGLKTEQAVAGVDRVAVSAAQTVTTNAGSNEVTFKLDYKDENGAAQSFELKGSMVTSGTYNVLTVTHKDGTTTAHTLTSSISISANEMATIIRDAAGKDADLTKNFSVGGTGANVDFTAKGKGTGGASVAAGSGTNAGNAAAVFTKTNQTAASDKSFSIKYGDPDDNEVGAWDGTGAAEDFIFEAGGKKFAFVTSTAAGQKLGSDVNYVVAAASAPSDAEAGEMAALISQKTGISGITVDATDDKIKFSANTSTAGGGLMLQIGETAETYNQLNVSISDMHTEALGIDSVNIGTQQGGLDAIEKIRTAINSVSGTRGDLGAIQNRLEHTINNLSVMTENIQDAEANVRDVDVAEEMMAYTKNNILVQASQAMLAQANQLPQGVLQLLG